MKKLVIIPAYNEEASIRATVESIVKHAPGFDYVVINDCSKDGTLEVLRQNGYRHVDLPVNLGIGGAVQTGYLYGYMNGYDLAVQMDGDGQHNPEYLEEMERTLLTNGASMVIGSRFITKEGFQSSALRRVGIRYFYGLIKLLTGKDITDPTSGMRMVDRETMKQFSEDYPRDYPEPESVVRILKQGKKVVEMPVIMNERTEGKSSIHGLKSVYYMIKVSMAIMIASIKA